MDKDKIARENILRSSGEVGGVKIEGYDFDNGVDYSKMIESFSSTGAQASHLWRAIEIVRKMISDEATIYLGYTSSMVSSGLRDVFRYLIKHKMVDVVVTTTGGIEEDIIKCLGDFYLGDFKADGKKLRDSGINRIGNIYAANNRYVEFENFFQPILAELMAEQKSSGRIVTASDLVWKLGEKINDEKSICYWAWKNKIKIYCPAITDGAIGDGVYFFKNKNPDFKIDVADDIKEMNDSTIGLKKSGVILLGSGVVKHHILNANMFRNGADYAVYINEAQEHNASDAGALPEEAISWGKLTKEVEAVKVYGDATILFPIVVAESFAKK